MPALRGWCAALVVQALLSPTVVGLRYHPDHVQYNLNQNQSAVAPLEFWGEWRDHSYNPSPGNWRFPFYTIFLDRFVNGDPKNDNANVRRVPFARCTLGRSAG